MRSRDCRERRTEGRASIAPLRQRQTMPRHGYWILPLAKEMPTRRNKKEAEQSGRRKRSICAQACLLYTSDAADDLRCVDLGGRRLIKKKNPLEAEGFRDLATPLSHHPCQEDAKH